MSQQFVFGPVTDDSVVLFTTIGGEFYYLKYDPKTSLQPYFGRAEAKEPFRFISFNSTITDQGYRLKTSNGSGLTIIENKVALSTSASGYYEYNYVASITPGTPLLCGVSFVMDVDSGVLTFKYKSPANEATDLENYLNPDYVPTYTGNVSSVFLVPIGGYNPRQNCAKYESGAWLAYSNTAELQEVWYSTLDWCSAGDPSQPCLNGGVCGECFGPCSEDECLPIGEGKFACGGIPPTPWYKKPWFWILVVGVVLIIVVFLVFFLLMGKKKKPASNSS